MTRLSNVVCLVLGLVFGIALHMFNGCGDALIAKHKTEKPDILKKLVEQAELQYGDKLDSIAQDNVVLQEQVNNSNASLSVAKRKNSQLVQRVNELVAVKEVLADTSQLLANCDTLEQTVLALITTGNEKDSLYDHVIASIEQQISNKDSTIVLQQQLYQSIKLSFDKSIEQQQTLVTENMQYQKQFKWQKTKSKLLSAGVLILTGIATYSLIRH